MMRSLGPRHTLGDGRGTAVWFALLALWAIPGLFALMWAAARAAAVLTDGAVEPLGVRFALHVIAGEDETAWPGTPTPLVIAVACSGLLLIAAAGAAVVRAGAALIPQADDPVAALARNPGLHRLRLRPSIRRARRLRPTLGERPATDDVGLTLGDLQRRGKPGTTLYASWEDTIAVFMGPRTGKTTALTIPAVLHAPGPVVATSNKADLWAATAAPRGDRGRVWLFDPQHITHQDPKFWWNPLAAVHSVEEAHRLAGHFVLTIDDGTKRDLWGPAAQELLTALFLAAASTGRTLREVAAWLDESALPTPAMLLADAGYDLLGSALRGTQHGAPETRDGIYQTARTAAKALRDERILTWITPAPGRPRLDPSEFVATGGDTLYLLSKDASAASPLIAALTDAAMRAAVLEAERRGGRLDPPLVIALDEAANICRIADLPALYSHLGSRGVIPMTILQSYEQGSNVWGEQGMAALWGAATIKLVGAGVDSPRLARDLATLIGQHDVPVRSTSFGDGRASHQLSLQRRDILEPAALRSLPAGTAVLLASGGRAALVRLRPYYRSPDADRVNAVRREAEQAIAAAAIQETP